MKVANETDHPIHRPERELIAHPQGSSLSWHPLCHCVGFDFMNHLDDLFAIAGKIEVERKGFLEARIDSARPLSFHERHQIIDGRASAEHRVQSRASTFEGS